MRTSFFNDTTFDRFRFTKRYTFPGYIRFPFLERKTPLPFQATLHFLFSDKQTSPFAILLQKELNAVYFSFPLLLSETQKIDIHIIQPYQLGKPHACSIKHFQHHSIPTTCKILLKRNIIQESVHFTFF